MRGRELKTFILPALVEARKRESCDLESPTSPGHGQKLSRSSIISDSTLPNTPTSSTRGHSRLPSSNSSLTSSPAMRESLDIHTQLKRPLTDVREEPQDREEDWDMIDVSDERRSYEKEVPSMTADAEWNLYQPTESEISSAYDFEDAAVDSDFAPNPRAKRRCAEDTPLSPMDGLSSRFGTRVPSFSRSLSRKWRSRKTSPSAAVPERLQDAAPSGRTTRQPSLAGSATGVGDTKGIQLPPTPRRSVADGRYDDAYHALVNQEADEALQHEDDAVDRQAKPTTPLLPPILTQLPSDIREVPYQSPLQSPSVADPEASSVLHTPLPTPRIAGLPSPPLSSKPSISSFHRQRGLNLVSPVSPTSDIPPMMISDPADKWTDQLGHANFTIFPEPYLTDDTTLSACKQVRADWETAKTNYIEHRSRIGENYGLNSKIYFLTEEKWNEIDATWKRNVELSFSRIPKLNQGNETITTTAPPNQSEATADQQPVPLVKTILRTQTAPTSPTTHSPMSPTKDTTFPNLGEGKFPSLGSDGIVGPMEVVAPQEPQRPRKRKRGFFRWVQGVWPAGAGAALIRRSSAAH